MEGIRSHLEENRPQLAEGARRDLVRANVMILLAVVVILLTAPAVGADVPRASVRDTSTIAVRASGPTPAAEQEESHP
jgi:hypothetical protein